MPVVLKIIYLGAAALALVAFAVGMYEYVIANDPDSHFGSHVFLPFAALVVIVALYGRRKRELESRPRRERTRSGKS